jgi:TRAP transporter TAXI family solute receptor
MPLKPGIDAFKEASPACVGSWYPQEHQALRNTSVAQMLQYFLDTLEEKMKRTFAFLFTLVLLISTGTGASAASNYDLQRLLLGTSSAGGTYYVLGAGWSNIVNKSVENMDITCEVTPGPTTNMQLIEKDEMDLGMVTSWLAGEAVSGTGWAAKHGAYKNFQSLFPTHSSYLYIYTLKDKGINTIQDFAGKHISVSSVGSTSDVAGRAVLDVLGIKPGKLSQLPSDAQVSSLKDGTIDAVFGVTGSPAPWLLDLETTHKFQFIQLSENDFAKILKAYPFWGVDEIPARTYKDQTEPYKAVSFWNFVVVRKGIRDDVVYDLVKTTYDHQKDLLLVDKSAQGVNIVNVPKMTVPLHPGALRYYKEMGVDIPGSLIAK